MSFAEKILARPRPGSIAQGVRLPRRQPYFASPASWRDEVLYFLLIDRFSDGQEDHRPLLDRSNLVAARPQGPDGEVWRWDRWAQSGGERYQGGTLRDFALDAPDALSQLARCYKYWIALTDCDGFRIDTLKHVSFEQARNFCGTIKEFAANLGKRNFLLIGEIAGGDYAQDRYLDVLARNLDAALDIGEMRLALTGVAKALRAPGDYFDGFDPGDAEMGSHRNLGERHVSILDDHDHVFGTKLRFSAAAASDHQVVAGVALQLYTLGIPCVYYGTEQALAGPEPSEQRWLPGWGGNDRYLREAMYRVQYGAEAADQSRVCWRLRVRAHPQPGASRGPAQAHHTRLRARSEWPVLLRDHHDGYNSWEEHEANQAMITDNANKLRPLVRGSPRKGEAPLAGLLSCGHCGRRPHVHHSGTKPSVVRYGCRKRSLVVQLARLVLGGPKTEEVARDIVPPHQRMQSDLP